MKTRPPCYYFYNLIATHYEKGSYVAAPCISKVNCISYKKKKRYMQSKLKLTRYKVYQRKLFTILKIRQNELHKLQTHYKCNYNYKRTNYKNYTNCKRTCTRRGRPRSRTTPWSWNSLPLGRPRHLYTCHLFSCTHHVAFVFLDMTRIQKYSFNFI